MTRSTVHLALDGIKLDKFHEVLDDRRKVRSDLDHKSWQLDYEAWRWKHPLLGQFDARQVRFDLALPGVIELVLEPRIDLLRQMVEIDHRFDALLGMFGSGRFTDVSWLVTRATMVFTAKSVQPLPQGFSMNAQMRQRGATVHVVRVSEGSFGEKTYEHAVRIETALGSELLGKKVTVVDHYNALSEAFVEVINLTVVPELKKP